MEHTPPKGLWDHQHVKLVFFYLFESTGNRKTSTSFSLKYDPLSGTLHILLSSVGSARRSGNISLYVFVCLDCVFVHIIYKFDYARISHAVVKKPYI